MTSPEPRWLHIGIDDAKAIGFLEELARNGDLRDKLEKNPRQTLLSEFGIDYPAAPPTVMLPPVETIQAYVDELKKEQPFGQNFNIAHGLVLLYVAHGNGSPPPPPPPGPTGN
jgi:hypothetical protein